MKIEPSTAGRSTVTLDEYSDLLAIRGLPDYRFNGEAAVDVDTGHLADAGMLTEQPIAAIWTDPSSFLFDYQQWIVRMALDRERFAVYADCGLGKTLIQLDWARLVHAHHKGRTLICAPLAVCPQTIDEAAHFYGDDLPIIDLRNRDDLTAWLANGSGIGITNYEKLDDITEPLPVQAVVLDESSVLKASMGKRRTAIMAAFQGVRWKLCCTATPAPNDRVEYAEHAYFLDVVRSTREFLAAFFINRDGNWKLKGHGVDAFYRHLAGWSVFMRSPAAYGFDDNLADLPAMSVEFPHVDLTESQHEAARRWEAGEQPSLFGATPGGVTSRIKMMQIAHGFELDDGKVAARFDTAKPRVIADLCNVTHADEQVIVWVTFDEEGDQLAALIPDAVQLSGKTSIPVRERVISEFRKGEGPRVILVKPAMFSFGVNLQSCRVQVFSTITDSYERYYQAVRRSHRYGQTRPVVIYVPLTMLDEPLCRNVLNKQATWEHDATMQEKAYISVLRPTDQINRKRMNVNPTAEIDRTETDRWTMVHGDSIAHMPTMPESSMDLAVFSPPFANLFTYSSAAADMGNVKSDAEYRLQWKFFATELVRVMKPGRIVAVHCMDVIRFAGQHGVRHTYDYPADLAAGMRDAGFLYRARIAIDKNPQIQATRTKDANLLFATLKRNALDSHPQASECVLVFTAPGEPEVPVIADGISNQEWIRWAHHVWYDIRETDVLNAALGKADEDERHICPLQLGLIERCVRLWSNEGETVFSPFGGIGSEGVESLTWGRRYYGVELKESYYRTARKFLAQAETDAAGTFDFEPAQEATA